jgi:FkbM family methyltransferase
MNLKKQLRSLFRSATGYDIHKADTGYIIDRADGRDALADIKSLIHTTQTPVIFDVGANVGQTIADLLLAFPASTIHAFEPGGAAFQQLHQAYSKHQGIYLNNIALGASIRKQEFFENSTSLMSSFHRLGPDGWGRVAQTTEISISTIDAYCHERGIDCIDLLKSDTQGFDLEVLKGGERMLCEGRVHLVCLEITFSKMYENLPRMDHIYGFLADRGFDLVSFYQFHYRNGRIGWTDALFINGKSKDAARR